MPRYSIKQVLRAIEVADATHTLDALVQLFGDEPIFAIEGARARQIAEELNAGIEATNDPALRKMPAPAADGAVGARLATPLCPC